MNDTGSVARIYTHSSILESEICSHMYTGICVNQVKIFGRYGCIKSLSYKGPDKHITRLNGNDSYPYILNHSLFMAINKTIQSG